MKSERNLGCEGMNCSCEEAAQFSFMVLDYLGKILCQMPLGQPCTPWDSGPPQLGTEKATLLSGTQLTPLG